MLVPFWGVEAPDANSLGLALKCEGVAIENLADPGVQDGSILCLRCGTSEEERGCRYGREQGKATKRTVVP